MKFIKDINKINERVSRLSNRNPDENMNKSWGDWLNTTQTVLEMEDEKIAAQKRQRKK